MPQVERSRWKDPAFVEKWKKERENDLRGTRKLPQPALSASILDYPLLSGVALSAQPAVAAALALKLADEWEREDAGSLLQRAHRMDGSLGLPKIKKRDGRSAYRPPELLSVDADGNVRLPEWMIPTSSVRPEKLAKAVALYNLGLKKKAQREIACGLLGGEVRCKHGHRFRVTYRCGDRFCVDCAELYGRALFARALARIEPVAKVLCPCWPAHEGERPERVMAKIDFTLRNCGELSTFTRQRALGRSIKKFFRVVERKFGITREQYGVAVHMETSGGNMPHAHAFYVGPWLPNKKKELSLIWRAVSPDGSFIVSIKTARNVAQGLAHATKYPRKLVQQSTPERLAELEKSYGGVRMFRLLGAFDKRISERVLAKNNSDQPVQIVMEKRSGRLCPLCGEPVSLPEAWRLLADLDHLRDIDELQREMNRERVFAGPHGPPVGKV
jgi:hypothetical protein